jgi:hypothetical protein
MVSRVFHIVNKLPTSCSVTTKNRLLYLEGRSLLKVKSRAIYQEGLRKTRKNCVIIAGVWLGFEPDIFCAPVRSTKAL